MASVTVNDCAGTGLETNIKWFMDKLERRFKITCGGLLTKHLIDDLECLMMLSMQLSTS